MPGKPISELEREYGVSDIVKLASNENPYGPSPAAIAAMRAALDSVWLYPDGSAHELKRALAAHLSVPPAWLTRGQRLERIAADAGGDLPDRAMQRGVLAIRVRHLSRW